MTKDRNHFFGHIVDSRMVYNDVGKLAIKYWLEIPDHFTSVILDEYIIMPNHIHGILIFTGNGKDDGTALSSGGGRSASSLPSKRIVSPKTGSLSVVIGSYKSICTKMIRKKCTLGFARQSRYHDRIIRNQDEYDRTKYYIKTNPKNRIEDTFH